MPTDLFIEFRFVAGKYHATPWDRHVNEGEIEWPPSPWRILRALMSVWYLKARDDIEESTMRGLIARMAASLPDWSLPPAVHSHTRHYMPLRKPGKTTKIFDAFARIDRDAPLIARWSGVLLEDEHLDALDRVLSGLSYLGRAESWVEARRLDTNENFEANAGPADEFDVDSHVRDEYIVPMPPERLEDWRSQMSEVMFERRLAEKRESYLQKGKDPDKARITKADERNIEGTLPDSVWETLRAETDSLRKEGWSQPPGTYRVEYARPRLEPWISPKERRHRESAPPTLARYALQSAVPPRLLHAISEADKLHRTLARSEHPLLCGRNGKALKGHQHAHILCEANGETDRITHISVWVPGGIDAEMRAFMSTVSSLWSHDRHPTQLALIGFGEPHEMAGEGSDGGSPLFREVQTWRSLTPFVGTRHPKFRGGGEPKMTTAPGGFEVQNGSPAHDLLRLLDLRGFPTVEHFEESTGAVGHGREVKWNEFKQERPKGAGRRGPVSGTGFLVRFAEPVQGPIVAGFGAHYGLGLFEPAE